MVYRTVVHREKFVGCLALCLLAFVLALFFACPALAAPSDAATQAADRLRVIAGTDESVTFWTGGTKERPDYTWTFRGQDISKREAESLTSLDLDIALSAGDADDSGTPDTLVLAFSHEGELPLPAQISVLLPVDFEKSNMSLFYFDDRSGAFFPEISELTAVDGYVTFGVRAAYPRAISTIDLAMWTGTIAPVPLERGTPDELAPTPDSAADPATDPATGPATEFEETPTPTADTAEPGSAAFDMSSLPIPLFIALGFAVVCVCAIALVVHYRRRASIAAMQKGWQPSELVFEDIPSLDDPIEVEEPRSP
jgi:hypothetical protein